MNRGIIVINISGFVMFVGVGVVNPVYGAAPAAPDRVLFYFRIDPESPTATESAIVIDLKS